MRCPQHHLPGSSSSWPRSPRGTAAPAAGRCLLGPAPHSAPSFSRLPAAARHTVTLCPMVARLARIPSRSLGWPGGGPRDAPPGQPALNLLPHREPDIYSRIPITETALNAQCYLPVRDSRSPVTASPGQPPQTPPNSSIKVGAGWTQTVLPRLRNVAAAAEALTVGAHRHNRCLVRGPAAQGAPSGGRGRGSSSG